MHWKPLPIPEATTVAVLQKELGVSKVVAALLAQRGIANFESAKAYFRPQWEDLHDPFLMQDMQKAVHRITKAIAQNEKIMVYGDYDVDGTTSVALMTSFLQSKSQAIHPYIPDRYTEGYGISLQGIDVAASQEVSLIIALDCGIKAKKQIAYAQEKGIDFIICDHHLPGDEMPAAHAILNPKRSDCNYPFDELCGCGIGFKLIQALATTWETSTKALFPYLDLVATAIAADIVPMEGENRVLAALGLKQIQTAPRLGIQSLLGDLKKPATVSDLVFKVAPRINAAGRMKHALLAAELLCASDDAEVQQLSKEIETYNAQRRATDEQITKEALNQIEVQQNENAFTTVVHHEDWHKGVVGIVASRLIETHYRPTIVLTKSGQNYVGSARSVKGFDVYKAIDACKMHLEQFGGHKYAAGLTLSETDLKAFKAAFEQQVAKTILPEQQQPSLTYDLPLEKEEITPKLYRIIAQMAPFGPKNMRPVFCTTNCRDAGGTRLVGKEKNHLRLEIKHQEKTLVGIAFQQASAFEEIKKGTAFDLLYTLSENEWNGQSSLQLQIKAIRFHS